MCCERNRRFLLLYASQKGQAKAIAEEICQEAKEHGFKADIHCISESEQYNLDKEKDPVVIVTSTTGTGEPPDTAIKFIKEINDKSLPSDHLSHIRYGLLGLGDSEYTFFCNGGKIIDKRFLELGAQRFCEVGLADDAVGLELVVEPWIAGLWVALNQEFASRKEDKNTSFCANKFSNLCISPQAERLKTEDSGVENNLSSKENINSELPTENSQPSLSFSGSPLSNATLNIPALAQSGIEWRREKRRWQRSCPAGGGGEEDPAATAGPVSAPDATRARAAIPENLTLKRASRRSPCYKVGSGSLLSPTAGARRLNLPGHPFLWSARVLCLLDRFSSSRLDPEVAERGNLFFFSPTNHPPPLL